MGKSSRSLRKCFSLGGESVKMLRSGEMVETRVGHPLNREEPRAADPIKFPFHLPVLLPRAASN